ncbi:MAG: hypothetical protein V1837_06460 [Candidatus Woesearchaeota archaeon]
MTGQRERLAERVNHSGEGPVSHLADEIAQQKSELANNLYSLARLHRLFGEYEGAVRSIKEAQELVAPSLESDCFLADNLAGMGRYDEAYEILRQHRPEILRQRPWMIEKRGERPADALHEALYNRCMDNCERLQRPVDLSEFKDWKPETRFPDLEELAEVAKRYHPSGREIEVIFHPFTYVQPTRKINFEGLTFKGVPFRLKGDLAEGTYKVLAKHLICIPQSDDGVNSGISFLETEMKKES